MGLYWTKCTKCNKMWGFCSVDFSMLGEPCKCDKKYHKPCDSHGNIMEW